MEINFNVVRGVVVVVVLVLVSIKTFGVVSRSFSAVFVDGGGALRVVCNLVVVAGVLLVVAFIFVDGDSVVTAACDDTASFVVLSRSVVVPWHGARHEKGANEIRKLCVNLKFL